jgi:hypothetical protein
MRNSKQCYGGEKMNTSRKNRILTSVCCVCGDHLRGPWPPVEDVSHGYCEWHFREAMQRINEWVRDRQEQAELAAVA